MASWPRSTPPARASTTAATSAGSDDDHGYGIAVDGAGSAYVAGDAISTQASFPVAVGPDLTHNGAIDAFVAKVNAAGTGARVLRLHRRVERTTTAAAIAVDSGGGAYVTGDTKSDEATFPVLLGPDLSYNGGDAATATPSSPRSPPAARASTTAATSAARGTTPGCGIAVDSAFTATVTGYTNSTEASFPVTVGPDPTHNGGNDAFVARVSSSDFTLGATPPSVEICAGSNAQYTVTVGSIGGFIERRDPVGERPAGGRDRGLLGQPGDPTWLERAHHRQHRRRGRRQLRHHDQRDGRRRPEPQRGRRPRRRRDRGAADPRRPLERRDRPAAAAALPVERRRWRRQLPARGRRRPGLRQPGDQRDRHPRHDLHAIQRPSARDHLPLAGELGESVRDGRRVDRVLVHHREPAGGLRQGRPGERGDRPADVAEPELGDERRRDELRVLHRHVRQQRLQRVVDQRRQRDERGAQRARRGRRPTRGRCGR